MDCTVYNTLEMISRKWSLMIILTLHTGKKRFSEIKESLPGITAKILSTRLKELTDEGVIDKKIDDTSIPVKSIYRLKEPGMDLMKVIKDVKKWGIRWKFRKTECNNRACKECMS